MFQDSGHLPPDRYAPPPSPTALDAGLGREVEARGVGGVGVWGGVSGGSVHDVNDVIDLNQQRHVE